MQPNPLHTAQIPQLIMKINPVSYSFEKTQKLEVSEGSGFHFLYLTLSVKGLKVDVRCDNKSIPPISFLHCFSPLLLC